MKNIIILLFILLNISVVNASNWGESNNSESLFFSPLGADFSPKYKYQPKQAVKVNEEILITNKNNKKKLTEKTHKLSQQQKLKQLIHSDSTVNIAHFYNTLSAIKNRKLSIINSLRPTMTHIFGGCIVDDSNTEWQCVDNFYISNTEVTNSQYRKFKPNHNSGEAEGVSLNGNNQPVVNITLANAKNYIDWLSKKTGKNYRLPTNIEWQYIANAGLKADQIYFNSANICKYVNIIDKSYCRDNNKVSADVASYLPNPWGLYDVYGNVWELIESINRPIAKGGSWSDNEIIGAKYSYRPESKKLNNIGFRILEEAL